MYCKNCGNEIKEGSKFCTKCGNEIVQISKIPQPIKKKNQLVPILILIILIGISCIALVVICKELNVFRTEQASTTELEDNIESESLSVPTIETEIAESEQSETESEQIVIEANAEVESSEKSSTEANAIQNPPQIDYLGRWDIVSANASSVLTDSTKTYFAENIFDGSNETAWAEGVDGVGIGEYIDVTFTTDISLVGVYISNGYFKSQKTYDENGKVLKMTLIFDDGTEMLLTLSDSAVDINGNPLYSDYFPFDKTIITKSVRIVIDDAKAGTKYQDTCISDITFLQQT